MRRICSFFLVVLLLCLMGCGKQVQDSGLKWDCSTVVPSEDSTYIAYSDAKIQTDSGKISFQNRNAFSTKLFLYGDGELISEKEMTPGGVVVFYQLRPSVVYTVGVHADQTLGTEIKVMAYDGNTSQESYVIPEFTTSE